MWIKFFSVSKGKKREEKKKSTGLEENYIHNFFGSYRDMGMVNSNFEKNKPQIY